ncbi:RecQ family zinc-binding domain-containing protein, partial [Synechocystis salina]
RDRAGRDLQPAECLTLISEPTGWLDSGDRQLRQYFLAQASQCLQRAEALSKQIPSQGNLRELKPHFPDLEIALAWLHRRGRLEWLDPFNYRIAPGDNQTNPLGELKSQYHLMTQYLTSSRCRWQTILAAFGDNSLGARQPCGTCDNCLAKRQ